MNEYEFTVTFTLRSPDVDVDDLVERLAMPVVKMRRSVSVREGASP